MDESDEHEGRFQRRRGVREPARLGVGARVGIWLVGAVVAGLIPLAVSLWMLSLARDFAPWLAQANPTGAEGSGVIVFFAFSVALFLEFWIYWRIGPSAGGDDGVPVRSRRQFFITYVLVPLVPALIVGYVTLSPGVLSSAIDWVRQPSGPQVERQVAQAIRNATASDTRVAGLNALGQFGSPDALGELAKLSTDDPRLVNDPASFAALVAAYASFGSAAEASLQQVWKHAGPAGSASPPDACTAADVVLAVYEKLDTIADPTAAYAMACEAALGASSGPARQALALAVIARTGSAGDFRFLATFLERRPERVTQAALDAMRRLDARLKKQAPPPPNAAPAGR